MLVERVPGDGEALASRAAVWIAERAWAAVSARGAAHVAVSGGGTPARMLAVLAGLPLPWDVVHVWQVDERVAPDGDQDRNASQLAPLSRARLHLMAVTTTDLAAAARAYAAELATACDGVLDVVHLGVGDDGHTASWPPGVALPLDADVAVVGPFRGRRRITLTPAVVNRARHRLILAAGAAKAAVLGPLVAGTSTAPVGMVRHGDLTVLADADALPELTRSVSLE